MNVLEDILLNRIYEELKQANVNRYYAEEVIDIQNRNGNIFNITIMIVSAIGAILSIITPTITIVTSVLISVGSLVNHYFSVFFLKSDDLTKLIRLHTDYNIYFNRLNSLFTMVYSSNKDAVEAQIEFDKMIEDNASKASDLSRLFGSINKSIETRCTHKSDYYLKKIFGNGE